AADAAGPFDHCVERHQALLAVRAGHESRRDLAAAVPVAERGAGHVDRHLGLGQRHPGAVSDLGAPLGQSAIPVELVALVARVAARLWVDRGVTMELVRSQLGGRLGPRIRPWRKFQAVAVPGMTAGGLRAMAESRRAAGSQPSTVGTRELLLGLLAEGDGVAA